MKVELGFVVVAFFGGMLAQDQVAGDKIEWVDYGENPMANPEFMKDWMASGTPGPEHERLAKYAGEWHVDGKMWMTPDGEPAPLVGSSKVRTVLGGRYSIEEYKSEFMGMPYEGMLIQGYCNVRGMNFSMWFDSMSTGPSISWGSRDEAGKVQSSGVMYDVMTPGGRPTRSTVTEGADGGATLVMYDTLPTGGEFKVMEMVYTRPKEGE